MQIKDIVLSEKGIADVLNTVADNMTTEEAGKLAAEICQKQTNDKRFAGAARGEKVVQMVRTAYLHGYAQGLCLMNEYIKDFETEKGAV